jgi:hypothetical protein
MKAKPLRRAGVLAGILAGPFFLVSVGLNTWAALVTFISLAGNSLAACRFLAQLAGTWAVRLGADCDLRYHGLTHRRPSRPLRSWLCSCSRRGANASFLVAIVTLFAWITALPYAWRRIPPKPPCAGVADERGALTAAAH